VAIKGVENVTGIIFILMYFIIIAGVIELSVLLFNLTGLEDKVSRFQIISMLTGTGFTTDESKLILDHPIRRNLSAFLILFGTFSLAVIISSITQILSNDLRIDKLSMVIIILFIFLIILKIRPIQNKLRKTFKYKMKKNFSFHDISLKEALALTEEDLLTNIVVKENSEYVDKMITDIITEDEDINLLHIKRGELNIRKSLLTQKIQDGDQLLLFGNKKQIENKFSEEFDDQ
jgi:hypothetical protein